MAKLTNAERNHRYVNTFRGRLAELLKGAKATAKQRGRKFTLIFQDLVDVWERQNGICAYTGWTMTTIRNDPKLVSIERVDVAEGYTADNIIFVCWCANRARNAMPLEIFVDMCRAVANNNEPTKAA